MVRRLAAVFAAGAGVVLLAAAPASAATPEITVSPSTGLHDGQSVTVTGQGFAAGDQVGAMQCGPGDWPAVSCDFADRSVVTTDSAGGFSTTVTVRAAFDGVSPVDGSPAGKVDCTATPGCSLRSGSIADSSVFASPVALGFGG
ncbi:enediyne antibiotic chromoprotein [Amycolatopsis anabasis]|uniref:enediyne antibiotic chromoprotein n=1 Tax=Amycolatopsis anabasis TaxID=1840409 RepID=UPI00131ABB14|nr:enediyne antibiotic chromoprotein [Amycolatopsis anabasis]